MAGEGGSGGSGGGGARDMDALQGVRSIVLKPSESLDEGRFTRIAGADFNDAGLGLSGMLASLATTGFQASNLGDAVDVVNQMNGGCPMRSHARTVMKLSLTLHIENLGDFSLPGTLLRSKGLNRIGNLLVPYDNYCKFENWIMPILDQMLQEQSRENVWTPSKVIGRLGKEINDENIRLMNGEAIHATPRKTGIIVLGGGLPKHHICNANMFRNGADFAVYINTAQEFDGSDSGAQPDEAVSWGKIKGSAKPVKVHCDATIAFPLLVAATFARKLHGCNGKVLLVPTHEQYRPSQSYLFLVHLVFLHQWRLTLYNNREL
uniref:Deoxyhypusine synthase n=1 Tax=Oryza meridionalis TaxID=40149 RepID=A0A0E0ESB3_9ORYZ